MLVYSYLRSEVLFPEERQGNLSEIYFIYYLISFVGIIFWGVIFRLRDEIKLNITMVTISLLVGLYLVEITISMYVPNTFENQQELRALEMGVEYDSRTKSQIYYELNNKGMDVVLSIHPSDHFSESNGVPGIEPLFPLGGISNKTTVYCNESGKYMIFSSDRYGFNNPDWEHDTPAEWVLIGDSYVQGACVGPGEDIAGQIRKIFNLSIVNLGIGGNGPLTEFATLREYGGSIKPKVVIWGYVENDLMDNLSREKNSPLLMNYLNSEFDQNLVHRQTEIDDRLNKYIKVEERRIRGVEKSLNILKKTTVLRLGNIRKLIGFNKAGLNKSSSINVDPLFKEILVKSRDLVSSWGGQLYFVYFPSFPKSKSDWQNYHFNKHDEVIKVVKSINLPIIDLSSELFSKHPDPLSLLPLRGHGHYNAKGYSEVAKTIVSRVVK